MEKKNPTEKKQKNYKRRLLILYVFSIIVCILPLLVLFFVNRNEYIKSVADGWKLSIGGVCAIVIIALSIIGKLKIPKLVVTLAVLTVLSYLLQSVLNDLTLIFGVGLLSAFIDEIIFKNAINATKKRIENEKTADATVSKKEELLKQYSNSGA